MLVSRRVIPKPELFGDLGIVCGTLPLLFTTFWGVNLQSAEGMDNFPCVPSKKSSHTVDGSEIR